MPPESVLADLSKPLPVLTELQIITFEQFFSHDNDDEEEFSAFSQITHHVGIRRGLGV